MLPSRLGQIKIRIYVEYVDQIYNHPIYIRIRRIFRSKFWQELPKKPSTTEAVLDLFQLRLASLPCLRVFLRCPVLGHQDAQHLILQAIRGDHEIQQRDLRKNKSKDGFFYIFMWVK